MGCQCYKVRFGIYSVGDRTKAGPPRPDRLPPPATRLPPSPRAAVTRSGCDSRMRLRGLGRRKDGDPPFETGHPQPRSQIVSWPATPGEIRESHAIGFNARDIGTRNLGPGAGCYVDVKSDEIVLSLGRVNDAMRHAHHFSAIPHGGRRESPRHRLRGSPGSGWPALHRMWLSQPP
jgi:hypothetical protein